jgi:hypothetical protein
LDLSSIRYKITQAKWLTASGMAALFWYVSLFPGRIGSDPIQAVKLMEINKSTDWWSSIYFWFLRITTFDGNSIWLASLLSLIPMYFSLIYFLYSLSENKRRIEKIAFLVCLSPLFGNFAVNINHDTFFTSGVFLLIGLALRNYYRVSKKVDKLIPYFSIIFLLNSKTGYFLIASFIFYLFVYKKRFIVTVFYIVFAIGIFLITSLGITKSPVPMHYFPFIADLKCVTQHPEARINTSEWIYFSTISTTEKWKAPKSCSNMDVAIGDLRGPNLEKIRPKEFFKNYFSVAFKNPAIVVQAHLQRSSMAMPPPFFQGPQNQVDRNIDNPVGFNTNIALQLGPEVLHPSIDYSVLKVNIPILKPLESIALFTGFLINQASWFWGWGGLWLWPIFIYLMFRIKERNFFRILSLSYPILLTHFLLFAIGPIPAPRYVMSTILVGNILMLFLLANLFEKTKNKDGKF